MSTPCSARRMRLTALNNRLGDAARKLWFGFFPPVCLLCAQPAADRRLDICAGCRSDLPALGEHCQRCAEPLAQQQSLCGRCSQKLPQFEHVFAAFLYAPPLTQLVTSFKFQRRHSAGYALGQLLADATLEHYRQQPWPVPEVLIPIPLHPWRQSRRGFNQAALLACDVARQWSRNGQPLDVDQRLLRRVRRTRAQTGLTLAQRRINLRGAFRLTGKSPQRVALIDDVMTSGSTANECARLLKQAGCESVQVWVVARAARPR